MTTTIKCPHCHRPVTTPCTMNITELLNRADAVIAQGPNVSYPSRASAQHIRDVVRDLATALRFYTAEEKS